MNTSGQHTKPPHATLNNSQVISRLASSSGSDVANPEMVESKIYSPIKKRSFESKPVQKNNFNGFSKRGSSKGAGSSSRIVAPEDTVTSIMQQNVTEFLHQEALKKVQPAWVDRLS